MKSRLLSVAVVSALAAAPALAANPSAAARAQRLLDGSAAALAKRASADRFVVRDTVTGPTGIDHVRFDRTYNGLPVLGGDVIVHSRGSQALGVTQRLSTAKRPALQPKISASRAIVEAGTRFGTGFSGRPSSRLVLWAGKGTPVLAHEVRFSGMKADQTPTEMHYIVDASNGRVLAQWDDVHTARPGRDSPFCAGTAAGGTGRSLTEGTVPLNAVRCSSGGYQLVDLARGGGYTTNMARRTTGLGTVFTDTDNKWGSGTLTDQATVAVDAHYGVSVTWDYYVNVHGRNGIANDGRGALSRVHYGRSYANAFWNDSCFCMTFGDGDNGVTLNPLVALDIAGHEMSHGVTSHTAGLNYSGESGGLNEATSDIFGTMVEFYANNPNDPGDYLIGEKIYAKNPAGTRALRYMFKPSLDGDSPDCYRPDLGGYDVHFSSGVANHFFYLLAEGAVVPAGFGAGTAANLTPGALVCNGNTALAGIGRAAAQKIWYLALRTRMVSTTDYAGARAATLAAAAELYGGGSREANAVAAAWSAVGVN
ncbi:MAG TPA: M4 family metallopeptidase [Xanthomonadaceae bacterium]|nr:M4 family metallopeptidase [Xanthomonadaceae bacterium]